MSSQPPIPSTPRVISPSPTPSEQSDYFPPTTRSAAKRQQSYKTTTTISEEKEKDGDNSSGSDSSLDKRARTRSRSPLMTTTSSTRRRAANAQSGSSSSKTASSTQSPVVKSAPLTNGFLSPNGHLSPYQNLQNRWRDFSRSPSPLGLIPLHRNYRTLIHKHEIPRKALHVSIGFITLHLYRIGTQPLQITPWLLGALIPIAAVDVLRHRSASFNRLYVRVLGALMRETEVDGYNGVIWYLLGAFIVLRFFPKDIGVLGVLLLSWCDTAASTFGRLYGRYTIRLRRGKSLAGSLAAWAVGVATAAAFYGWIVPAVGIAATSDVGENAFMFQGTLNLIPATVREMLRLPTTMTGEVSGSIALGVMSFVTGVVASASELVDLWGWDDNFTIPVLSGIGLWGFLKACS